MCTPIVVARLAWNALRRCREMTTTHCCAVQCSASWLAVQLWALVISTMLLCSLMQANEMDVVNQIVERSLTVQSGLDLLRIGWLWQGTLGCPQASLFGVHMLSQDLIMASKHMALRV